MNSFIWTTYQFAMYIPLKSVQTLWFFHCFRLVFTFYGGKKIFMKLLFVRTIQQAYPSFWPEKSKMEKYGPVFSVHSVSRKHYQNIKQWEYKINKKVRIGCSHGAGSLDLWWERWQIVLKNPFFRAIEARAGA